MTRGVLALTVLVVAACGGPRTEPAAPAAAFDPSAPGPVEMPGEPMNEPFPWRRATGAAAAVVAAWVIAQRVRRRDSAPAPAAAPSARERFAGAHVVALQRLERLRTQAPRTPDDHIETASIVREYVEERFGIRAGRRSTEELVESPQIAPSARRLLADVLARCDLVKFACDEPPAAARAALLDAAEAFVRETAAP